MVKKDIVTDYIIENIEKTVFSGNRDEKDNDAVLLPYPFSAPCIDSNFTHFFYWDTYFINLGLLQLNDLTQTENNLKNIQFLIKKLGFMPNANNTTNRSQPPLFTRAVYDFYNKTKNPAVIKQFIEEIVTELNFWEKNRKSECGLNAYGSNASEEYLQKFFDEISLRLNLSHTNNEEKLDLSKKLLNIAESGWDFTPRYKTEKGLFEVTEYAPVDLNSILYDAEMKASIMLEIIGEKEKSKFYFNKSQERKKVMHKYMRHSQTGVFLDYNFKSKNLSEIYSAASFCVYAFGVDSDIKAAKILLKKLSTKYGIAACEKRKQQDYLQWDYPNIWAPCTYFGAEAFKALNKTRLYNRISKTYNNTVKKCFIKTGKLWEKYNAETGNKGSDNEYNTPAMLGWTAGVYLYLQNKG